ncbi:MAG: SDR family oxidoreductase [Chloroflexi bacterium]|nr:SDR family oxidoreductase [Chloroflexota bacterium]
MIQAEEASLNPPGPLNSAYGTAKAALSQMIRHLAAELAGTGAAANVIHPGDILDTRSRGSSSGSRTLCRRRYRAGASEPKRSRAAR